MDNDKIDQHSDEIEVESEEKERGKKIEIDEDKIKIYGPTKLNGCEVVATDLRAGACLVLAGLVADNTTIISDVEHILRGYENIVEKLQNVGAKIEIIEI